MKAKNTMAATGVAAALMACGVLIAPAASAAELVGPGCADYAAMHADGPASVRFKRIDRARSDRRWKYEGM